MATSHTATFDVFSIVCIAVDIVDVSDGFSFINDL